jgi:hypothetical protein
MFAVFDTDRETVAVASTALHLAGNACQPLPTHTYLLPTHILVSHYTLPITIAQIVYRFCSCTYHTHLLSGSTQWHPRLQQPHHVPPATAPHAIVHNDRYYIPYRSAQPTLAADLCSRRLPPAAHIHYHPQPLLLPHAEASAATAIRIDCHPQPTFPTRQPSLHLLLLTALVCCHPQPTSAATCSLHC